MDADWTASALFSPSKARAQQAQAKDWAAVENWLSRKYGSRLPPFERNEDTLQALLTLANLNEGADEQRGQMDRIEKTAYQSLTKRQDGIEAEILQVLQMELANETHLDTLAETIIALDCPHTNIVTMGKEIIELGSVHFRTKQQVQRAENQLTALKEEQARLQKLLAELKSDVFQPPPDVVENTTEWTRSTKTLKAKVAEYEERLSASRPTASTSGIEQFQQKTEEIRRQKARLAEIETEMRAFQNLPSDARSARKTVERARDHLRELTARRDDLFEELAENR